MSDEIEIFGPYRLEALLGRGGMGEVWRAFDTRRERAVALKRLVTAWSDDDEFRERFRLEARATARLGSPHVIPIHDFGEIDGRLFIDMRLISGGDLAGRLAEHPRGLGAARAVDVVEQVAGALEAAHRDGLVHRDVKPSNVLLESDGVREAAYLVDFGIAKLALEVTGAGGLTAAGTTLGTPAYMAPELFDNATAATAASDVYALGCVLHETLTGRRPFPGGHLLVMMNRHRYEPAPVPSASDPALAPFDAVVARALAKDPAARPASAAELRAETVRAAARAAAPPRATPRVTPPRATPPRATPPRATPPAAPGRPPAAPPRARQETLPGAAPAPPVLNERRVRSVYPNERAVRSDGEARRDAGEARRDAGGERRARRWWRRRGAVLAAVALVVVLAAGVTTAVVATRAGPPASGAAPAVPVLTPPAGPERVLASLDVPAGLAFSPDGRRAYIANSGLGVVVLDVATRATLATVPLPGASANEVALTPDGRRAYVPHTGTDSAPGTTVSVIDTGTNTVVADVGVGVEPIGATASLDGRHVYVANYGTTNALGSTVSVIDTATNLVTATVPVGIAPSRMAASPDGQRIYVADNGESTVTAIDTTTNTTTALPAGDVGPIDLAVAPDGRRVYVTAAGTVGAPGSVQVLDTAANSLAPVPVTGQALPYENAIAPDGGTLVVTYYGSDQVPGHAVALIDTATRSVRRVVPFTGRPSGVAIAPGGREAWVTTDDPDQLWRIPTG